MSVSLDENALTFARFVDQVTPNCAQQDLISYVNPRKSYRVSLRSRVGIPNMESVQQFEERELLPIATELGLSMTKTAKLISLRNAWVGYFREGGITTVNLFSPK